jgi:hypothetical protein
MVNGVCLLLLLFAGTVCCLRLIMERMSLRLNCMVMKIHCDLTKAKEMVKNVTAYATVLLNAILWSCQGRFTLSFAELFVVFTGSTGVAHEDGVVNDAAHARSSEEVLRDKETSPIMSNWLLVCTKS